MNRFEKSFQNQPVIGLAPRPSIVYRPGLPALPEGTERHKVAGGGSLTLEIKAGDRLTVTDLEGGQPCEVAAASSDGKSDAPVLDVRATNEASGLRAALAGDGESAAHIRNALARRGIDLGQAKAFRLVGATSPAVNRQSFTAQRDGILIIGAPGGKMDAQMQDTATPIEVRVERAHMARGKDTIALPEPLSDPLQDIRVDARTAKAYTVRAGEYIQIIDVSGRQMTDFQCFSRRKLDQGIENALDGTVTRTLTGRAYPTPGLLSKMFGFDFEPLVEVIQDTVGRHDFFATACNSRYYDDVGYPGHGNCTENFNRALEPYEVAPRKGWEAINYFYNTRIDDHNQIYFDEAWSRPGDYVLMRALTDLVCVSSACPDDINVGNGWDPSDIHVRTYSDKEKFSRAVAYRMKPDAEPQLTRETAFHPRFSALTAISANYAASCLQRGSTM